MGSATQPRLPRRGDRLEVSIERIDQGGDGVGPARCLEPGVHDEGVEVAVRGGVIGELLVVEALRRRRLLVDGRPLERLAAGPHAREPRCPHFGTCGGCSFQTLDYAVQLVELRRHVQETLDEAGLALEVEPVLGMGEPWHYRNKMDFTFGSRRWVAPDEPQGAAADFALGLHVAGRHDKVLDLASCAIHFAGADALVATVRDLARARDLRPWDLRTHTGLLRHLVLRAGRRTGEVLVDLVTSEDAPEVVDELCAALLARHPEVTTVVQNVNTRAATTAFGERERVLFGPGVIHEELCGLRFAISANSFFQTNTLGAEQLFRIVAEEAVVRPGEVAYDLYCGAGTIALVLARAGARVLGFELAPSAVADARRNAAANGLSDAAEFFEGDVQLALAADGGRPRPDVVVVDPPRAGLHPKVVAQVADLGARRLVYVSCNVRSAARDLPLLAAHGYRVERARPVDLFPHTPHVEVVFRLTRTA